jgi:hypothetical protein
MRILSFDVGIVNLAYCIIESETQPKINHWEIIELTKRGNTFSAHIASSGIAELYLTLIKELDARPQLLDVDVVLIEKQPSFNPKMRIVAGCLQTYFYIRGVVDKTTQPIKSVEFFSPKHKLKCYTGPELDISSKNGKLVKGKYAQTKKMGIAIARSKLEEYNETFVNFFESSKKRDDLSDCYLQALTYLTFKQQPSRKFTKSTLKQQLRTFLDNCTVTDITDQTFKTIKELEFPFELPEPIEILCAKFAMKKYIKLKFN